MSRYFDAAAFVASIRRLSMTGAADDEGPPVFVRIPTHENGVELKRYAATIFILTGQFEGDYASRPDVVPLGDEWCRISGVVVSWPNGFCVEGL